MVLNSIIWVWFKRNFKPKKSGFNNSEISKPTRKVVEPNK